ncbi:glutamine-dependent NAD(+) synthetase, variant 2 [Clarireedia jacksonii]
MTDSINRGPELEVCGYGCLDHFLEGDTDMHCWESLSEIIQHPDCQDILLDIGMPVKHKNVRYNCRLICYNKKILLIRPKLSLANDGNYYEMRYFTPWKGVREVENFYLPRSISKIMGQKHAPIGDALLSTTDTCLGAETCEELFTPNAPHIAMGLDGCEIFTNSSGSHHELRKLHTRVELITSATLKSGGIYIYANQQGCDGDRLYYDGCAMIIVNGRIVAQASQFSLNDVEVISAIIDLEEVRSYREQKSRAMQARDQPKYDRIEVEMSLSSEGNGIDLNLHPTVSKDPVYHLPEEEIATGPACYLWDYLRRAKQAGYFLPLSGGIDSCATAIIIHSMTRLVYQAIQSNTNPQVLKDLHTICGEEAGSTWIPESPKEICNRIFCTAYMGMEAHSSPQTRKRAADLAEAIGAYHTDFNIDPVYDAQRALLQSATGFEAKFKMYGGTKASNLALQNIQARLRMVNAYTFAQLLPQIRGRREGVPGSLLVLGSANVDESLRGYLTKYDCSSADINPIGGISKTDLKRFILWASKPETFGLGLLHEFLDAPPTAELEPLTDTYVQADEVDMGMTYDELSVYGRLRKINKLGVYSMWEKLCYLWGDRLSPQQIYEKTRFFHWNYAINRHKMTTITPAYHMEAYGVDDNRFDQRPFLYPSFEWGYRKITRAIEAMGELGTRIPGASEANKASEAQQ